MWPRSTPSSHTPRRRAKCSANHEADKETEMDAFDMYGELAEALSSPTLIAGRSSFQVREEACIADDVSRKLTLQRSHRLLEIGCGVGVLLNGLAARVERAVGLDHANCIARYRTQGVPANVELVAGRWPEVKPAGTFDRILVYSVMHYLPDETTALAFIEQCMLALRPGGALLLGDIPNADKKRRFATSTTGKRVAAEYSARVARHQDEHVAQTAIFARMDSLASYLNDAFILALTAQTRAGGGEAYLLHQPDGLPFWYTREDVLLCRARES
jgi:2-polyprenyl-3-methyl-5-hydroxy-6-metoxy-1,4-benzoquinol methylase